MQFSAAFFSARIKQIKMLLVLLFLSPCELAVRNYSEPAFGILAEFVHKIMVYCLTLSFLSFPVMGL